MSHPELPPELVDAIQNQEYACVTAPTDQGTVFVVKAPGEEIEQLRGPTPIGIRHELHRHPCAPVIRTVLVLYDQPDRPLMLESFINVADAEQRADFMQLAWQDELELLFYDEHLVRRLTKRLRHPAPDQVNRIAGLAHRIAETIPPDEYDFDRAKRNVMANVEWPPRP